MQNCCHVELFSGEIQGLGAPISMEEFNENLNMLLKASSKYLYAHPSNCIVSQVRLNDKGRSVGISAYCIQAVDKAAFGLLGLVSYHCCKLRKLRFLLPLSSNTHWCISICVATWGLRVKSDIRDYTVRRIL